MKAQQLNPLKVVLLSSTLLILVCPLASQEPEFRPLPVAHPWDPNSGVPSGPTILSPIILSPSPLNATTWTALGPAPIPNGQRPGSGPVTGRIAGIATDPGNANIIYIAAAGGGVWKTIDGGANWTPLTDSQATLSMGAIAVAPSNPQVIYAGTGEANFSIDSNCGRGILVSTNGGATWTLRNADGAFDRRAISEIAVDPTNANIVYAAAATCPFSPAGNKGVWKSTDAGVTWTNTTTSIASSTTFTSVRIDPNNPNTLYAAVGFPFGGSSTNGVYKTTNGGASWSLLANAPGGLSAGRIVVAVSKSNSQVVYVSASSPSTFRLYKFMRSDDGGATFTDLTGGTPNYLGSQGWYDTTLIIDPTNSAIVYVGGQTALFRSITSGATWTSIASAGGVGPHVDHHAATFDANGKYLDGDDGGIYRYDPVANTWTSLNGSATFLNTIQFQGIGLNPTNMNNAFGGSQDNGTSMYSGTLNWTLVESGDGGFVKFSKQNPARVYHQMPVDSGGPTRFFRTSTNGGTSWSSAVTGITDTSDTQQNFYAPFAVDPSNGNRALYGAAHLWETTSAGSSWTAL
jgi:photosystem II stability/assembly factor-like uncharacterized protein